jgi:hypothetical protein
MFINGGKRGFCLLCDVNFFVKMVSDELVQSRRNVLPLMERVAEFLFLSAKLLAIIFLFLLFERCQLLVNL